MKLSILSEYAPPPPELSLVVNQQSMMGAVHDFLELVDNFFKTGRSNWIGPRVEMKYGDNTFSILVRCGIDEGRHQGEGLSDRPEEIEQPRVVADPSWDGSIEMRLDIPRGYREQLDWSKERNRALRMIAAQASMQLPDALSRVAGRLITQMKKSGKITDFP